MSDFWVKKVGNFFSYLDLDKDGFVSKKDIEEFADLFHDPEKIDPAVKENARGLFVETFRQLISSDGSDDSGLLTAKIMTDSLKQLRHDPKFMVLYTAMVHGAFTLIDLDQDGFIQADEYARMFTTVGILDLGFVKPAFDSIDLNHDGKISREECIDAYVEYITTEDEKSPYKLLYGYLV